MSKIYLPTSTQMDTMNEHLNAIANAIRTQIDVSTWAGVQTAVRKGVGQEMFPVGTRLSVDHSTYGTQVFEVVAHDYLTNESNPQGHTMTLMLRNVISSVQFDGREALYHAPNGLMQGTYNFTVVDGIEQWAAGTYQFTLTQDVPHGGLICIEGSFSYDAPLTSAKIKVYGYHNSTDVLETADLTVGSEGTFLGNCGEGLLNVIERVACGSNNYAESAIRQFLNSSADKGSVWSPQTKFDRPPLWKTSLDGYKKGLDASFLAVLCPASVQCTANTVWESPDSQTSAGSAYTLTDDFYLPSKDEIFSETSAFSYYRDATSVDREKYYGGASVRWWLRTPSGNSYTATAVDSGEAKDVFAANVSACAPCCTIG